MSNRLNLLLLPTAERERVVGDDVVVDDIQTWYRPSLPIGVVRMSKEFWIFIGVTVPKRL